LHDHLVVHDHVDDLVDRGDVGISQAELLEQRVAANEVGGRVVELGDDRPQLVGGGWVRPVVDDLDVRSQLVCNRDRVARRVSIGVVVDPHGAASRHRATVPRPPHRAQCDSPSLR
jgi:hypothetical protein